MATPEPPTGYFVIGDLQFKSVQGRTRARTQLGNEAAARGFVAQSPYPDSYAPGMVDITIGGKPGMRFAYLAPSEQSATEAMGDLATRFDLDENSQSGVVSAYI